MSILKICLQGALNDLFRLIFVGIIWYKNSHNITMKERIRIEQREQKYGDSRAA